MMYHQQGASVSSMAHTCIFPVYGGCRETFRRASRPGYLLGRSGLVMATALIDCVHEALVVKLDCFVSACMIQIQRDCAAGLLVKGGFETALPVQLLRQRHTAHWVTLRLMMCTAWPQGCSLPHSSPTDGLGHLHTNKSVSRILVNGLAAGTCGDAFAAD